jgi:hypothetical protein
MRYTGTTLTGNTQIDKSLLDLLNKINALSEADVLTLRGIDANGKQILSNMSWNKEAGTVDVTLQNGVTGQMFQELHIYVEASEDILNGQVVQFTGASTTSNMIKVGVANTNTPSPVTGFYDPATVLGVATQDIKFGKSGYITWFGSVRDLDTTMWNEGDLLYLDADNPGKLTTTYPAAGQKWVNVGIVQSKGFTNGEIFIRPVFGDNLSQVTLDPTGFDTPENITMTYNSGSRTVTLTGTFQGYWQGNIVPTLKNSWTSDPHPVGITQSYFLYYNKTNGFSWSSTPWEFTDLMIAFVAADSGGAKFCLRECHGTMPWRVHQELHQTIGTYLMSGGDLSNYTIDSTTLKLPYVSSTQIKDEDNISTEPVLNTASYTLAYLTSTGIVNFTLASGNIVPLSGTNPYYNLFTGGSWTQSLVTNNSYMTVWLFAMPTTADAGSQSYRYIWLQGQSMGDLSSQQILSSSGLSLGNLTNLAGELVFIDKIILRYTAGNWSISQVDKLTGTKIIQTSFAAGNYLSSVSTNATLSGTGTATSPLAVVSAPVATSAYYS